MCWPDRAAMLVKESASPRRRYPPLSGSGACGKAQFHSSNSRPLARAERIAMSGLCWGTLIGVLLLFPIAPLVGVAGGVMGAALGTAGQLGIKDEFKARVQDMLQPGTSAILVIVRKATPDKFLEALRPYGGTVLQTSLTPAAQEEAMKAFHGGDSAPAPRSQGRGSAPAQAEL